MFADISGFTKLTETVSKIGSEGLIFQMIFFFIKVLKLLLLQ